MAIAGEAGGDQGVVVRPDRAVVIGHGIVACLAVGNGADAPTRIVGRQQEFGGDGSGALGPGDAGKEGMPGIAGSHLAGGLGTVESQRVAADLLTPETAIEALAKRLRLPLEVGGARRLATAAGSGRTPPLGGIQ